ncbi:MAG: chemotaxis protein CheW [Thermodesulfobacteriota bacterium]|jgi:chemotaxis signal transduction protein|nr:chemotaxis protein CheW [Thermodesulfobacteriota bacterium]
MAADHNKNMYLVFRIGVVGFCLPVSSLVEILDGSLLPGRRVDSILLRGTEVPVIDGQGWFECSPARGRTETKALVVAGAETNLALMVDAVDGIFPAKEFEIGDVPALLCECKRVRYRLLAFWRNEPLVVFDPNELDSAVNGYG